MGLSVSRLLSGLFGKKEMRKYMESMMMQALQVLTRHYFCLGILMVKQDLGNRETELTVATRSDWTLPVRPPSCTS